MRFSVFLGPNFPSQQTVFRKRRVVETFGLKHGLRFRKTPLWRSKRKGILRNVAVILGNRKNPESIPVLLKALCDKEPLIRGSSAWALGEFEKQTNVLDELQSQLAIETDEQVQTEIKLALANHGT